ncbi:carbohydrate kinase family protein [Pseudonocardia sp. TRM90224]|uniref:carbohydrate kinase family protein n=1 Tax=Pseudonocardia sp. TRM90224 TaxID=2812678 RepID=UPI001E3624E9|nr:carbohydrate kinase family protein [Pseudonocardia sp. TRM90224]
MIPSVVTVGYASLDHAMRIDEFRGAEATTHIRERLSEPWPAPGGVAHLARAAAATGSARVGVISWLAADELGRRWLDLLVAEGVDTSGVRLGGSVSPHAYLLYEPSGRSYCLYAKGDAAADGLDEHQLGMVVDASWVLLAASPSGVSRAVVAAPRTGRLAWAVKHDAEALPPELVRELLAASSVITFSEGEEELLRSSVPGGRYESLCRPDALLVRTRGARGLDYRPAGAVPVVVAADEVRARDTTGAGDTLAGTLVALIAAGDPSPMDGAVDAAIRSAMSAAATRIAR